jgi:prepilin-type N-terminal cleavage/methylation domain-containing protein
MVKHDCVIAHRLGAMRSTVVRNAFTLPEVLIAILLLAIGMGGLAAVATAIAAQAASARELEEAALLTGSAIDSLRAAPCHNLVNGTYARGRATIRWMVTPARQTVAVTTTLTLPARSGSPRVWLFDTLLPCDR